MCLAGANYAFSRERLRRANLHEFYQQINRQYFDGQLQDASVEWNDLTQDEAMGITRFNYDGSVASIELDPHWNTSEAQARAVIEHEACHVSTFGQEEDPHGRTFLDCMKRFEREEK